MLENNYESLITELISLVEKFKLLTQVKEDAEFDLKWRLTELYKYVKEEDEQKFIDISGMSGHLTKSSEKQEAYNSDHANSDTISEKIETDKKIVSKSWAKRLYKRSVKCCHPDLIRSLNKDYRNHLVNIYKNITESYENDNLDILMTESYKLFIKPEKVLKEQIEILEVSKKSYTQKIQDIISSESYAWSYFDDNVKEDFLINLMKQKGVRFLDRAKVKEIISRRVPNRKPGQKPKNNLKKRVKK